MPSSNGGGSGMDIRVKQHDVSDCGAACLVSVARHYQLDLELARIRQRARTNKNGTSILGMVEAAESFGFEARGVKGQLESLYNVPLPAIAHTEVNQTLRHFVVITGLSRQTITIMDPADGELHKRSHDTFEKEWTGVLILILPSVDFCSLSRRKNRFSRFWCLIKPHRSMLLFTAVGALMYTILGLSTSIFIQKIVDQVIADSNLKLLNLMGIGMIIVLILRTWIKAIKDIFILRTGQQIDSGLILGYYRHLLNLPQHFFDTRRVGEITSRINDAVKIRLFINEISINLLVGVCMLVSSLALMFTYYWKLACIMFLIVPFYSLIYFVTDKLNRKSQRKVMEQSADYEAQLIESLNGIETIKRLSLEHYAATKTETRFRVLLKTVYRSGINSLVSNSSTDFISQAFTILILWIGSGFVISRQLSPGELLSFYALIGYFTAPVLSFVGMNKAVQDALISGDRLFEIMDMECEPEADGKMQLAAKHLGNIKFEGISFAYDKGADILANLDMDIPLKQLTAIVGESGCGKSTLVSLLHNIYPFKKGDIFIGQYPIRSISVKSLREIIAVVPQATVLFSGSFIDNITIGFDEIDMKRVLKICTRLGIMDFIEKLPNGFLTEVGENGVILSGGQKQRIAIARAIYRDPEILVLDEATSSLDPVSDQFVQQTISDFLKLGKTVIIIAHRLSTIQKADKIIVLKDGLVAEQGTHAELMACRSAYYQLWTKHTCENAGI